MTSVHTIVQDGLRVSIALGTSDRYCSHMPNESVGLIIARARQRQRMTQVQLAEALGVSPSSVANWERGAAYPAKYAGLIEELLGIAIPAREHEPIKAAS